MARGLARILDHQRHMAGGIHHRPFTDGAKVAHHVTVIAGEENQGVFIHAFLFQRLHNPTDLVVHKRDAGIVEILGAQNVLPADLQPLQRATLTNHILKSLRFLRTVGRRRVFPVQLLPGSRGRIGRVGMNEGGNQQHRPVGRIVLNELHAPVPNPLGRMVLRRKLGELGHIVHLTAHPVVVEHPGILPPDIGHIIIALGSQFLLGPAFVKADGAIRVPQIVHLSNAAAAVPAAADARIKAGILTGALSIIVVAAGAGRVLPGEHGVAGRDTNRGRRNAAVKNDGVRRQCVQVRGLNTGVSKSRNRVPTLLIGEENQYIFHKTPSPNLFRIDGLSFYFHFESLLFRLIIAFLYYNNLPPLSNSRIDKN